MAENSWDYILTKLEVAYQQLSLTKDKTEIGVLRGIIGEIVSKTEFSGKNAPEELRNRAKEISRQIRREKAKRTGKTVLVSAAVLSVLGIGAFFAVTKFIPDYKYNQAVSLYAAGNYDAAIEAFTALHGYRDSRSQIVVCKYDKAMSLIGAGSYDEGYSLLQTVRSDYPVDEIITETEYSRGVQCLDNGDYTTALSFFESTLDYGDSEDRIEQCYYGMGVNEFNAGNISAAIDYFTLSDNYSDADDYLRNAYNIQGDNAYNAGNYIEAISWYDQSGNAAQISECNYNLAQSSYAQGDYLAAAEYYETVTTHDDLSEVIQDSYYNYLIGAIPVENQDPTYYTELIGVINNLDPDIYSDVDDLSTEAHYRRGVAFLNDGAYYSAVEEFDDLGNYQDSNSLKREAMYQYVLSHRNRTDTRTYDYLTELRSANYQDSRSIYSDLYAWSADVRAVTGENSTTTATRFSRHNHFYFRITLEGGTPNGSTTIRATFTFPDGSTSTVRWDGQWYNGTYGTCWYYYNNPSYGATGTGTLRVYDSNGNCLGQTSVTIY